MPRPAQRGPMTVVAPDDRGGRSRSRERDLRTPARHLSLDATQEAAAVEPGAVALGARLQLVGQRQRGLETAAWRLGFAPHVVVGRGLGFRPGFLDVGHHEHDAIELALDVSVPLLTRRKAGTSAEKKLLEVIGELV